MTSKANYNPSTRSMLDTHKEIKALIKTGLNEGQAESIVSLMVANKDDIDFSKLATKEELAERLKPLVTKEELVERLKPLVTKEELAEQLDERIRPLATKSQLDEQIQKLDKDIHEIKQDLKHIVHWVVGLVFGTLSVCAAMASALIVYIIKH